MRAKNRLDTLRIRNFKAIRDTGPLKLTPFTALIGNNGSGKSSLLEALLFIYEMTGGDLNLAVRRWRGFEHVLNKFSLTKDFKTLKSGMEFRLYGEAFSLEQIPTWFRTGTLLGYDPESSEVEFRRGELKLRDRRERTWKAEEFRSVHRKAPRPIWAFSEPVGRFVRRWQFLTLDPLAMGAPQQTNVTPILSLYPNGSNLAEYLHNFAQRYPVQFEQLVDTVRFVVPYMDSIQPEMSQDVFRTSFISLVEQSVKIPGWMMSSGTLRVTAILACLLHPNPPTLLVIEEIENGLDPRTIGLLVSVIRDAVESGRTQVIATTHSPYFLDLVPPEYIMTCQRDETGEPRFRRVDPESLGKWAKDFTPGRLYTMGVLDQ